MKVTAVLASLLILVGAVTPTGAIARSADYCLPIEATGLPWTTHLVGDIDGDGRSDGVTTQARTLGSGHCRARLVVSTRRATFHVGIEPYTGAIVDPPGLAGLMRLLPGRRLQIAVVVWLGASTGFLDVYGLRNHRLVRLSAEPFPYAGSVITVTGVDCVRVRGAELVASSARWNDTQRRYHVERVFFALRHGVLKSLPRLTEHHAVKMTDLGRFPELTAPAPFPSCTLVQGHS